MNVKPNIRFVLGAAMLVILLGACATAVPRDNAFTQVEHADAAYRRGDWAAAEKGYRAVTQAVPSDAYAHFRLGNTLAHQGRFEAAIGAYREALTREPHLTKAYHNLATVYLLQAEQALVATRARLRPGDPGAGLIDHKLAALREATRAPLQETRSPAAGIAGLGL